MIIGNKYNTRLDSKLWNCCWAAIINHHAVAWICEPNDCGPVASWVAALLSKCVILVICFVPVLTCQDPGTVAHSHRVLTGSRFTVGSTLQFVCNKGYVLSGSSPLTCCNRDSAAPKWSDRLPKCVRKSTWAWSRRSPRDVAGVGDSVCGPFSGEVRAVQEPRRRLHQHAELWEGLLPSRGDADLLLPPWLRAAGWGHHLLYPWAPFTVE